MSPDDPIVRSEIAEQPAALARLLASEGAAIASAAAEIRRRRPRYAVLAARGTSDNAARYAQHLLGRFCGLPVALATPSLHTLYHAPLRYTDAVVIGISQSGASPDVVSVVEAGNAQGAISVAITNDPESPLAQAAHHVIALQAGRERSVAATKTYTTSLGAIAALTVEIAEDATLEEELAAMPAALEAQLALTTAAGEPLGDERWQRLAVTGRGANYGTAFEAALKIKELTGVAAEPYSPADFLHGPIAIVGDGFPVLAIAVAGPALAGTLGLVETVQDRGAAVTLITDKPEQAPAGVDVLEAVAVPEWLSPLVTVVPAQLLAVGLAERLGVDVDAPAGLQKITRTV